MYIFEAHGLRGSIDEVFDSPYYQTHDGVVEIVNNPTRDDEPLLRNKGLSYNEACFYAVYLTEERVTMSRKVSHNAR